jgi:hypothetical protein
VTIHFNIILPYMPGSSKWSPSLRSPPPKSCTHLSFPPYVLLIKGKALSLYFSQIGPNDLYQQTSTANQIVHMINWSLRGLGRRYDTMGTNTSWLYFESHSGTQSLLYDT